jgi:hypothetical protein
MRLVSAKTVFFAFCGVRSGNPGRWTGQRRNVEYPSRFLYLTPTDFYLWGDLKKTVYARDTRTL